MTYFDYVKTTLLQPAGITEVKVFSTLASQRSNDMAIAEDEGLGLSPLDLTSQLLVPQSMVATGRSMKWVTPTTAPGRPRRP